jgi:guanylate kinase
VRRLVPDLFYSVSHTTRLPRPGEVNGTDFHFVSEPEFLDMRDRDGFAEWAEVHGNYYGTPVNALEGALSRGSMSCSTSTPTAPGSCVSGTPKRSRSSSWRRP